MALRHILAQRSRRGAQAQGHGHGGAGAGDVRRRLRHRPGHHPMPPGRLTGVHRGRLVGNQRPVDGPGEFISI